MDIANRKRAGFVAAGTAGLIAAALWPSATEVDVAAVTKGALVVTVDEEGETRVRDRFVVSAPLSGRVLRIELEPGDPVAAGQTVLATFQPSAPQFLDSRTRAEAEAALKAAEAALGRARAEQKRSEVSGELAASELERHRALWNESLVSRERLDGVEAEARAAMEAVRAAEFAVASAEYAVEQARARLLQASGRGSGAPIVIRAPIDGVVLRRLRESESVVPAGEPLLEVADPARLEIVADYLSTDAVKIRAGQRVQIERWGGDGELTGIVRRVEPAGFTKISALGVEEQRVNVIVDFHDPVEAWNVLGDAYRVETRIVVWERAGVLRIPTGSLFRDGEVWAAFAVEGGRARLVHLELGARNARFAEVISGVAEGATVVLHPGDALGDGERVTERSR